MGEGTDIDVNVAAYFRFFICTVAVGIHAWVNSRPVNPALEFGFCFPGLKPPVAGLFEYKKLGGL